jgi:nitrile hydratase accessory protein
LSSPDREPVLSQSPGLRLSEEGAPVFPEPWAAEAFAITVHLHERGLFSWSEWAETLSAELKRQDPARCGEDYFDHWVAALTTILVRHGVADQETVLALQESWQRAAEATPHGKVIELRNDQLSADFASRID